MVQYSTIRYSTVQYSTVQYSTVQYSTVPYSTLHYAVHCVMQHRNDEQLQTPHTKHTKLKFVELIDNKRTAKLALNSK